MPFSVLVVDDSPSVVQVLSMLLDSDERFAVSRTAYDGLEAVEAVNDNCPDAVICEIEMPRMGGLDALQIMHESCPASVIVVYTSDPGQAQTARHLGADDVVDKTTDPAAVIDIVAELSASRRRPNA